VPQVPVLLQSEPEVGRHTDDGRARHLGSNELCDTPC
jgi:hypothetical protein